MPVGRIGRLSDVTDGSKDVSVDDLHTIIPRVDVSGLADNIKLYSQDPLLWKVLGLFTLILLVIAIIVVAVVWLHRRAKKRPTMNEYIAANQTNKKKE